MTIRSSPPCGRTRLSAQGGQPGRGDACHRIDCSGEAIFSPSIATRLIDFFANLQPTTLPQALPELTGREREILSLIAQGHSNAAIAQQPSCSVFCNPSVNIRQFSLEFSGVATSLLHKITQFYDLLIFYFIYLNLISPLHTSFCSEDTLNNDAHFLIGNMAIPIALTYKHTQTIPSST
jgi:hypothetical protein